MKPFTYVGNSLVDLEVVEDQNGVRYYLTPIEKKKYPSITTVLGTEAKVGIEKWKKRVGKAEAERVLKYATTLGTNIHSLTENYLLNKTEEQQRLLTEATIHERMMFGSFSTYLNNIDNIVALEAPLYSNIMKVAGRTDCIAEYEGKLSIIDFKTSKNLKEEYYINNYYMQGTAYSLMYQELTKTRIEDVVILMVNYDCSVSVYKKNRKEFIKPLVTLLREALPKLGVTCEI
jgi:hypothetical protein